MSKAVDNILQENQRRLVENNRPFNPLTGEGSVGERFELSLPDFPLPVQYLPVAMQKVPLVKKLAKAGSIEAFFKKEFKGQQYSPAERSKIVEAFVRLRCKHDFPFWAASFVKILSKTPGEGEIMFRLTRPQRKFVTRLEEKRMADKPIRFVMLKARQWGGSTTSQIYMMWLQLVHKVGLNSVIIAQTKKTSFAIKAMFDRALKYYPMSLLYEQGAEYNPKDPTMVNVGLSGDYKKVPQRDCTITIASYEAPDALRGDAYALVHCSEVGLWNATDSKSPESVMRSISGVALAPYTMIIYESTANGTGNFFHREYEAAKAGLSQFDALFVPWCDIDIYSKDFASEQERRAFAEWLYHNRNNENTASNREEPGKYLWWLWEQRATLEAINWYIAERAGKNDHAVMASEYPSDDIEAFVHSGANVFDRYQVDLFRPGCRSPKFIGDVYGDDLTGADALANVKFKEDAQGQLWVWALPEPDEGDEIITDRYLTVVDIGGRSNKADWSVIMVLDRLFMMDGDKPVVVAQWYGHIDMDLLAWKAAQVAAFYNNSLLVIESNTLETHSVTVDGDQSTFILSAIKDIYPNLYARKQSEEDIRQGVPRKYGFHTNTGTKPMLISTLQRAIREQLYVERDERCLDEYLTYERKQNGSYGAIDGKHDDLLMTRAIALRICFYEMDLPRIVKPTEPALLHKRTISEATI